MAEGMTYTELIHQLAVASELEHGLCLQYLFTAFSLKNSASEGGLTMEELTYVRKWKSSLFFVAAQEMLHLAQAGNLASAIGSGINLRRPNFPQRPGYYPTGLPWGLWPFSRETIILYALYERPAQWRSVPPSWLPEDPFREGTFDQLLADAPSFKDPYDHLPRRFERPKATEHQTIGELYAAIAQGFRDIPGEIIIGPPEAQVPGSMVDFPQLVQIFDRENAFAAIELIVEQGEGLADDRIDSHFGIFVQMYAELAALKAANPAFEPARDVQSNPLSTLHVDNSFPGWRLIQDPYTREVNDLNNGVYALMLLMLRQVFEGIAEPPSSRATLASVGLRLMTGVVAALGETLTRLPMGDDGSPGKEERPELAGPSFELDFTPAELPFPQSAWQYYRERMGELAASARRLAQAPGAPETLAAAAVTLERLRGELARDPA